MNHHRVIRAFASWLIAGLCLALAGGCASEQPDRAIDWPSQPRPLALPAMAQRQLDRQQPARRGLPWYAVRNEYKPTVAAGIELPVLERSITRTSDRQHIHGNRVRDHYHQSTYRERIRRTVR